MLVQSVTFTGEYPRGLYWSPGEVRELAADIDLPAGLVEVQAQSAAVEPAASGEGEGA
jgi:hypothetical protein